MATIELTPCQKNKARFAENAKRAGERAKNNTNGDYAKAVAKGLRARK